jgi:hypothetical protein
MVDFSEHRWWEKNRLRQHRFQIPVVRPSKRCEVPVPCSDRENRPSMQTRDIDYRDPSDRRSWASMRSLLDEVFR